VAADQGSPSTSNRRKTTIVRIKTSLMNSSWNYCKDMEMKNDRKIKIQKENLIKNIAG